MGGSILPTVKESVQDVIQRWMRETGLSAVDASERAKKRGRKISSYYIEDMAAAKQSALYPGPKIVKAAAAGFGKPEEELVAAVMDWNVDGDKTMNGLIREIADAYTHLPPGKQKERARYLLEIVNRELQREL